MTLPPPGPDADDTRPSDARPAPHGQIGPYRLIQVLGAGGMGEVWLAEQAAPVRRLVAVKIIKRGMDSAEVIARFKTERQALALMTHPAIATVIDGGMTPDHRPYFAMEYVKGEPITTYCNRHQLDVPARLGLFLQVCEGVQHAHQKGILHRDLKPSNVLVTIVDDHPVPKIIDFGLAKAMAQPLTDRSFFTELGVLMGTPEYMSPEQAEMGGLDVDIRTDVYALGVLLYEMLTGLLPFDRAALRNAGIEGIRRVIRQGEPPQPSSRVAGLGSSSPSSSNYRQADAARLAKRLRGDLDWIVMKAIEKDRTRRYSSASDFAGDVRRHLELQPVMAGPPSATYRLRKFARRHRAGVTAATLAVGLLTAFAVAMSVQASRVAAERDVATRERHRAERTSAFLASLFEASDPDRARGKTLTAPDLLDIGRRRLDVELKDEPQTRAALLHTIGHVYNMLGRYPEAESALGAALDVRRTRPDVDRADLADTLNELANIHHVRGDLARARALYAEVLQLRQGQFGSDHILVARAMANLANIDLGEGRFNDAEGRYRQAADLAGRVGVPEDAAAIRSSLGSLLLTTGRTQDAIDVLGPAVEVLTRVRGIDHTMTQTAMQMLANAWYRAARYQEAEAMQRVVLDTGRRVLGDSHFRVGLAHYNLGRTLDELERWTDAEQELRASLAIYRGSLPGPHAETAWTLSGLGSALLRQGRLDDAERAFQESIDVFTRAENAAPVNTAWPLAGLGDVASARRQFAQAERYYRQALDVRRTHGATPYELESSQGDLGRLLCEQGSAAEGEVLVRAALDSRRKAPLQDWETSWLESTLGTCLVRAQRLDEAEVVLSRAYEALSVSRGPGRVQTRETAAALARLFVARGQPEPAALWRARALPTNRDGAR